MKLIIKQHLCGAKGSFEVGSEIAVDDATALRYIKKGIALPKTQKELEAFMKKAQSIEDAQAKKEAEAKAILESDKIKVELNSLYVQVILKEAELNADVLADEDIVNAVEALMNRNSEK